MSPERFGPPDDPLVMFLNAQKEEMKASEKREKRLALATGGVLALVIVLVGLSLYIRGNDLEAQNSKLAAQSVQIRSAALQNRRAIRLLCRVSRSFNNVILDAADQIELAFKSGTYARLLKAGILTKKSVKASRDTLESYRETHKLLKRPKPCEQIGA